MPKLSAIVEEAVCNEDGSILMIGEVETPPRYGQPTIWRCRIETEEDLQRACHMLKLFGINLKGSTGQIEEVMEAAVNLINVSKPRFNIQEMTKDGRTWDMWLGNVN